MTKSLTEWQDFCHDQSAKGGWWDRPASDPYVIAGKIALIHSEISEALEAYRTGKNDDHLGTRKGIEVELADAIIRILDLAGALELDLESAMTEKMQYNLTRADHTKGHRAAPGGKKI